MNDNFASFPYSNPTQISEDSKVPVTLGNMGPSEYYVRDIQAMHPQSTVLPSVNDVLPPVDVKGGTCKWQLRSILVYLRLQVRLCE